MADNVLTNQIGNAYIAVETINRELTGHLGSISRNSTAEEKGVGQVINSFVSPQNDLIDITHSNTVPDIAGQTWGNRTLQLTKQRAYTMQFNNEEWMALKTGDGSDLNKMMQGQFMQAYRSIVNEMETDISTLHINACRAIDPAGTDFFDGTDYADLSNAVKLYADNGSPGIDRQMILDTTTSLELRKNPLYVSANTAGGTTTLRTGEIANLQGMSIKETAANISFTKGTNSSGQTNAAGYAIGATVITLDSAGTGSILAGDIITFAGDANKYVVESGDADVSNGGTITLSAPGLREAIAASTTVITTDDLSTRSMTYTPDAIILATRVPAHAGDGATLASSHVVVQDPVTNLAFDLAVYPGFHRQTIFVSAVWGFAVMNPQNLFLLAK